MMKPILNEEIVIVTVSPRKQKEKKWKQPLVLDWRIQPGQVNVLNPLSIIGEDTAADKLEVREDEELEKEDWTNPEVQEVRYARAVATAATKAAAAEGTAT